MDKRLEKTIKEEEKLKAQMDALKDKLNGISDKREAYEKEELYKLFKVTEISLEEYKIIVEDSIDAYLSGNSTKNNEEKINEEK